MPIDEDQQLDSIIRNRSVVGGINTRFHPLDIQEDEAVDLTNIDTSTPGQRVKRSGFNIAATGMTYGPVLSLSAFKKNNDSEVLLAVAAGATAGDNKILYEWDGVGSAFSVVGALTGYTADPFSPEGRCEIIVGTDFHAGGTNTHVAVINTAQPDITRIFYDSASLAECTYGVTGPESMPLQHAYTRGWGTGKGRLRNFLYFSDVAAWTVSGFRPATNAFVFGGGTKQEIISIQPFRQRELIIGMSDRIEELLIIEGTLDYFTGGSAPYATYERHVIDSTIGMATTKAVAKVGEDLYFADQSMNVRSLARTQLDAAQGTRSLPMSEPLDSWVKRINPAARHKAHMVALERFLFYAVPIDSSTVCDYVFRMDTTRSAQLQRPVWDGPWTNFDPHCMTVMSFTTTAASSGDQNETLYVGQNVTTSGLVMRFPRTDADNGAAIKYQETTKRFSMSGLEATKNPKRFKVFASASAGVTMCFEQNRDAGGFQIFGYANLLGDATKLPANFPLSLGGSGVVQKTFDIEDETNPRVTDIQFRMTVTTTDQVKVLGYSVLSQQNNFDWTPD